MVARAVETTEFRELRKRDDARVGALSGAGLCGRVALRIADVVRCDGWLVVREGGTMLDDVWVALSVRAPTG